MCLIKILTGEPDVDDVDRIKRSLLSNATTTSTTTTNTAAATTTTDVSVAMTINSTSSLDGPVLSACTAQSTVGGRPGSPAGGLVSSQTVALDGEDSAAVDELLTAYRESLRVQADVLHDPASSSNDYGSLMQAPMQLRSHSTASSIPDLVNVAELSVRRVIAMAKQV